MVRKDYPGKVQPMRDIIPTGLRKCPLKFQKKQKRWVDQYCEKGRCGWWNDEKGRSGYIK